MTRDWRTEPRSCAYGGFAVLTREEQDAWDEHEAHLIAQGQHDRAAYLFTSTQSEHVQEIP